jgi:hypothetical protein
MKDNRGLCRSMTAKGRFGVPEGWITENELTVEPSGERRLRTVLTGPSGESGIIERGFDGTTLTLEKAYKSTLPTRVNGIPGFTRPASTINFLTARAFTILGVTANNLARLKVSRLQRLSAPKSGEASALTRLKTLSGIDYVRCIRNI